jgi:hypothetical protein
MMSTFSFNFVLMVCMDCKTFSQGKANLGNMLFVFSILSETNFQLSKGKHHPNSIYYVSLLP